MAVIAVDAGTTMIKAVGYDEEGTELVVVRQATSVSRPHVGWAEQDMLAVWDAVVFSVRSVQRQLKSDIDFLAITAQGDGCWLVDQAGEPTGPAILWNDGRAAAIVEDWSRQGLLEKAFQINGSQTFPGLPNAILTWLKHNDPERLERSHASLTCGGWLFARMTGELAIDESDGAAPFMDIRTRRYSPELLKLYGMEWARTFLPELRGDDRRVAALTRAAALEMGLPAGLPIVMSSYDIASTAIGVGAVAPGQACSILGTTLCTEIVADKVTTQGKSAGLTVALGLPGKYLNAFPTLAGGEVIQWACQLLDLDNPTELAELADACPPGANGLAFIPYLSPAGERAPFLNAQARGAFLGLSFDHGRGHVARAVLEGLTLVIRDCLSTSGVTPTELRVCGGGAANPIWLQLIADITGVPVLRSTDTEVGAKGAFLIGLVATGGAARIEDVSSWYVRIRDTFTPDPGRAGAYAELYEDFLALRATVSETWPRLASMRQRTPEAAGTNPLPVIIPEHVPERSADLTSPGTTPSQIRRLEGTTP